MLWAAIIWEHIKAIPGALERMTIEGMVESLGDIFSDPDGVLLAIVCWLLLWALVAIAKLCAGVVEEQVSQKSGTGSNGRGLN